MIAADDRVALAGAATPAGTARGSESFGAGARTLGRTGLSVTPIGFGGYRVTDSSPVHRRALSDALRGGINLIDTSTNYTDGGSERLVGRIVANLVQQGEVRREQVVVVSKLGYVQGQNLARVAGRSQPYAEVVEVSDQLWHCIEPAFIGDQLEESRARLGLARIDVMLLHNPEYFLMDAGRRGVPKVEARETFLARIEAAFAALEQAVADGAIGWYGVSSNGFGLPADALSFVSVAQMLAVAERVGGPGHHFGVVQMPMNLLELGAMHQRGEPGQASALAVAERADLGVLVNRPLNAFAIVDGAETLVRLADAATVPSARASRSEALAAVRKLEAQWATGLGKQLVTEAGEDAGDLFRWGREISAHAEGIESLQQWSNLRHEVIAPHLAQTSAALLSSLSGEPRAKFAAWWEAYGTAMHAVFTAIEGGIAAQRHALAQDVAARLDPLLPEPWRAMPLSAKAVLCLLGAPLSAALVGMRQPGYVADMLMLRQAPVRVLSATAGAVDLGAVGAAMTGLG